MEELIKYFQNIEARLAALEAAEQAASQAEPAQDAKLAELTTIVAALSAKNNALEAQLAELKAKLVELEARPAQTIEAVAAPVAETVAQAEEPAAPAMDESEEIAIDDETGEPELEVEFIEEEVAPAPAAIDPLLDAEIVSQPVPQPAPAPKPKAEAPKPQPAQVKESVADAAAPTTTIADAAAQQAQRNETISSIVPKLEDIRKGISLSDRFLFQRELFAGNGELMNKTIDKINSLSSLAEAEQYIAQFGWDKESNAYELFTNLLKRRW